MPKENQEKTQGRDARRKDSQRVLEKFDTLRELSLMVGRGVSNSLMVSGPGGMGKSFTVTEVLTSEAIPYRLLRGYASPTAFYNFLHTHLEELIVVDDCDNIFKDSVGLNILKAILETVEPRRVSWQTPSPLISVSEFNFSGRVIFLTNMGLGRLSVHMEAMLSRVHFYHLELSPGEVLAYMKRIALYSEYKGIKKDDRLMVVRFLRDNCDNISRFNIRHYVKALDLYLYSKSRWRKLFMSCVAEGRV